MIKNTVNGKVLVAHFGFGSLALTPSLTVSKTGILDLASCSMSTVGKDLPKDAKVEKSKIRLTFHNTEGIDALITKLQDIKSLMEESNGTQKEV